MGRRRVARFAPLSFCALVLLPASACEEFTAPPTRQARVIPLRPMVRTMFVQAARNDDTLFLRVRFPANEGTRQAYFHRVGGSWRKEGGGFREIESVLDQAAASGSNTLAATVASATALSETALSVALATTTGANAVPSFGLFGCFLGCHDRSSFMPNWLETDGRIPMFLLTGLGGFADVWTWRAHRTAVAGIADDESLGTTGLASLGPNVGLVADAGTAPWTDLDLVDGAPPFVFDPATAGGAFARPFEEILASPPYFFTDGSLPGPRAEAFAEAVKAGYTPKDDDAVPAQVLSRPSGSRADVAARAGFVNGFWDLTLSRALATTDATHDVQLATTGTWSIAFAMFSDQSDGRDHYVSLPIVLTLGGAAPPSMSAAEPAPIVAVTVPGAGAQAAPVFDDGAHFPVTNVEVFLPGITSFDFLVGAILTRDGRQRLDDWGHGGRLAVASSARSCADCHAVASGDPAPPNRGAGALDRLVPRRGGVYDPTPQFVPMPAASGANP